MKTTNLEACVWCAGGGGEWESKEKEIEIKTGWSLYFFSPITNCLLCYLKTTAKLNKRLPIITEYIYGQTLKIFLSKGARNERPEKKRAPLFLFVIITVKLPVREGIVAQWSTQGPSCIVVPGF